MHERARFRDRITGITRSQGGFGGFALIQTPLLAQYSEGTRAYVSKRIWNHVTDGQHIAYRIDTSQWIGREAIILVDHYPGNWDLTMIGIDGFIPPEYWENFWRYRGGRRRG